MGEVDDAGSKGSAARVLEAGHRYLDYVGRGSFYGFPASLRRQLFRDEEFSELYCRHNGRNSAASPLVLVNRARSSATNSMPPDSWVAVESSPPTSRPARK